RCAQLQDTVTYFSTVKEAFSTAYLIRDSSITEYLFKVCRLRIGTKQDRNIRAFMASCQQLLNLFGDPFGFSLLMSALGKYRSWARLALRYQFQRFGPPRHARPLCFRAFQQQSISQIYDLRCGTIIPDELNLSRVGKLLAKVQQIV